MLLSLVTAHAALTTVPSPATDRGAHCRASVHYDNDQLARVVVPAACPEPFRTAILGHLQENPFQLQDPPEILELQVNFGVGRKGGPVQPLEEEPSAFALPPPGSAIHLPDDVVRFKKQPWPRNRDVALLQPVTCRAEVAFDLDGLLETAAIRGCPSELAASTREALAAWRVKPRWHGVPVRIQTRLAFTFTP